MNETVGAEWIGVADGGLQGLEARHLHAAAEALSSARVALEHLAAVETDTGRRLVYRGWAAHLLGDWRGVALLAACVDPCGLDPYASRTESRGLEATS
jgi:hypothetical protein